MGHRIYKDDGRVTYYETDQRAGIAEEDLYAEIIGSMLNLMEDYDMDLDEAADSWSDYADELITKARTSIANGTAKSRYELR